MKNKILNVTYQYSMIGTVSIEVPENMSIEEAIEYAKENIESLPLPQNGDYLDGSSIIDEENCDFDEE